MGCESGNELKSDTKPVKYVRPSTHSRDQFAMLEALGAVKAQVTDHKMSPVLHSAPVAMCPLAPTIDIWHVHAKLPIRLLFLT
jgi:hypothetical protein